MNNTKIAHVNNINIQGSSRIGFLSAPFEDLISLLGCPLTSEGEDKNYLFWKILFEDGRVMMIEMWGPSSKGKGLYDWHVWGLDRSKDLKTLENALNIPVHSNVGRFFDKKE